LIFFDRSSFSLPPTRPVFIRWTSMGWVSSSSRKRLPCSACFRGKNGFVPGTRRNFPSSALPPAEVPGVSPSMKYAAAWTGVSRHRRDEVVLDGLRVVLRGEVGGGLARAGQPDDQEHLLVTVGRHHLAARVQGQAAPLEDDLVPHAQAALFDSPK